MKIHRDKIIFKSTSLGTEEGRNRYKETPYYKQIKASMEKHGMINPLICVQNGELYKICVGMNRFIIGCDLGMQEFDVELIVLPNAASDAITLEEINLCNLKKLKYKPTDADFLK